MLVLERLGLLLVGKQAGLVSRHYTQECCAPTWYLPRGSGLVSEARTPVWVGVTILLEICLGTLEQRSQLTGVGHVPVVLEFSANALGVGAPKVTTNVPVQRVAQHAAVDILHILLVHLAERSGRARLPSDGRKHAAGKRRGRDRAGYPDFT